MNTFLAGFECGLALVAVPIVATFRWIVGDEHPLRDTWEDWKFMWNGGANDLDI